MCLALAGTLVYLNTLSNPFVFDDTPWVLNNTRIRSLANLGDMLTATNRPVMEMTLALNYALGGDDPAGYHLFNLIVHVLAGLTLYGLIRRTLRLPHISEAYRGRARWLAGVVALLWLLHPLNTQSVTYMIQRGESMMGLCYLFTLYGFVRYATGGGIRWALCAVAVCWIGAGCKEVIATVPLVVLLYDLTFIARTWREPFAKRSGLYLGLFLMWVPLGLLVTRGLGGEGASAGFGLEGKMLSRWTYLLTQPQVIVEVYLRKAFWPNPLVLDYAWVPAIPEDTPAGEVMRLFLSSVLWQGLIVVGLFIASAWGVIRRRWWGFVGASFFLILAPTSSFVPIADIAVEHRMYLPLISVVVILVFGVYALLRLAVPGKAGAYGLILAAVIASAFGMQTVLRNLEYASRIALWDSVAVARPYNARGWHNMGKALEDDGQFKDALTCYQNTLSILPSYSPALFNMGVILMEAGQADDASECFRGVVSLDPKEAKAHEYLGLLSASRKETDQAVAHFREAVRADPDLLSARQNLAAALNESGHTAEAAKVMDEAIKRAGELGLPEEVARELTSRRDRYRAQAEPTPDGP